MYTVHCSRFSEIVCPYFHIKKTTTFDGRSEQVKPVCSKSKLNYCNCNIVLEFSASSFIFSSGFEITDEIRLEDCTKVCSVYGIWYILLLLGTYILGSWNTKMADTA